MKVSEICDLINGRAFKPEDWDTTGLPIVRIQNLNNESAPFNYFSGEYSLSHEIDNGELLFSWSGTPGTSFGAFRWYRGKAILNQHIYKVLPKIDVDKDYLLYALNGNISRIISRAHGGVGLQHITKKELNEIAIRIVPREEQSKIIKVLNQLQHVLTSRRAQLAKLDELVKCRFVELFGDPVTNPKSWQLEKLADLGELARGISKYRPRNAPVLLNGPYPLIQTGDISKAETYITDYTSSYSEEGLKQSKLWPSGTLVITIAANIAETSILTFPACFPDSVVGFIAKENRVSSLFIHYWFTFFQQKLEHDAPQVAQKNINLKILSELLVIVPPMEVQLSFTTFVSRIDKLRFFGKAEIIYGNE